MLVCGRYLFHGAEGHSHLLAVVLDRAISLLFELESRIQNQFFACGLAEGLRPAGLPRVLLHFEVLVALRAAEAEGLRVDICADVSGWAAGG